MGLDRLSLAWAAASVILAVAVSLTLLAVPALRPAEAWSGGPALNTIICAAAGEQDCPAAVTGGHGGAVVAWQDHRGPDQALYIQRAQGSGILGLPPGRPSNVSPAAGEQGISLAPTLQCSAFSPGQAADTHAASQWRITTTAGDYDRPVFDSGADSLALLETGPGALELSGGTSYYWQVRHLSSNSLWSAWSAESSFTTLNRPPFPPDAAAPAAGAAGVSRHPRLESSAFSDPDGPDMQSASQWQISTEPGDYRDPVFDNARLAGSPLNCITVSPGLDPGTTYYWRVRYRDSQGAWSEWSEESSFTTGAAEQAGADNGMSAASWVYIAGIALAALAGVAAVLWLNASAARPAPPPGPQ